MCTFADGCWCMKREGQHWGTGLVATAGSPLEVLKRPLADICCSGCFWPVGCEGRVHIDNLWYPHVLPTCICKCVARASNHTDLIDAIIDSPYDMPLSFVHAAPRLRFACEACATQYSLTLPLRNSTSKFLLWISCPKHLVNWVRAQHPTHDILVHTGTYTPRISTA